MKPLRLTLDAVGPYPGRQVIDFVVDERVFRDEIPRKPLVWYLRTDRCRQVHHFQRHDVRAVRRSGES